MAVQQLITNPLCLGLSPATMLRQAARRLLSVSHRSVHTSAALLEEAAAVPAGLKEFADSWAKKAPQTLVVPEVPSNFIKSQSTGESLVQGELFPVNFYTPHSVLSDGVMVRPVAPRRNRPLI